MDILAGFCFALLGYTCERLSSDPSEASWNPLKEIRVRSKESNVPFEAT